MAAIEKQVEEEIKILKQQFSGDKTVEEFEKTIDRFEDLVNKGMAQKRGYNLLSATDAHIKSQTWFNAT